MYIMHCVSHYIITPCTYTLYTIYYAIQEAEKAAKEAARKAAEEEEARRILEEFTNKYAIINLADGTTVTPTTPTTTADQVKVLREVYNNFIYSILIN